MASELRESFRGAAIDPRLQWSCEPPRFTLDRTRGALSVETAGGTDFWQRTHYGFRADNGHLLRLQASGNFVLTTRVTSFPKHQYDQAGLMLRLSVDCWLKTSVEFEPGEPHNRLGAVVTNAGYSDWSTQPLDKAVSSLWFRIRAETSAVIVESSLDASHWQQLRMAHLAERTPSAVVECGLYCCSPKEPGYRAEFHCLDFEPRP
jgi:uncharacterized protein